MNRRHGHTKDEITACPAKDDLLPAEAQKAGGHHLDRIAGCFPSKHPQALVLAQNRAKAMLKKANLSEKERKELRAIARMRLPDVTKKAA